jgi:large subunit ribosomal protein L21
MYAIVETGGKQYKVSEGDILKVEKLVGEAGDKLALEKVLIVSDDEGNLNVGKPAVENAKVLVEVLEQGKSKKIIVYKYKKRKNQRKKQGHRQAFTKIRIEKIEA